MAFRTGQGTTYQATLEDFLASPTAKRLKNKVQLIFTSPPFPLNRKKKYGNRTGEEYIRWLARFAQPLCKLLKRNGSIAIELGNAWEPGHPVMSPLALKALLRFLEKGNLNLCQQFICYNPARLPTPAQWVNVERIRVKDAYTHIWWMAPSTRPKANNRRVLQPYGAAMEHLLKSQKYNAGHRPSGHRVGKRSFLKNNKGAIPSNVLTFVNTRNNDPYLKYCRKYKHEPHPARMPVALPDFFIKFLTLPGDLVLDPFAGSNTTGAAAQALKRKWIAIEPNPDYIDASRGRFNGQPKLRK